MGTETTPAITHATALYALWERNDGSLRQRLGDAIVGYLRRNPTAREQFHTALRLLGAVREPHRSPDGSPLSTEELRLAHTLRWTLLSGSWSHARAILVAWTGADEPLRKDIQAYITLVTPGEPKLVAWLKRLSSRQPPRPATVDVRTASGQPFTWMLFE